MKKDTESYLFKFQISFRPRNFHSAVVESIYVDVSMSECQTKREIGFFVAAQDFVTESELEAVAKFLVLSKFCQKRNKIRFEFSKPAQNEKKSQIYSTIELGLLCMIVQATSCLWNEVHGEICNWDEIYFLVIWRKRLESNLLKMLLKIYPHESKVKVIN